MFVSQPEVLWVLCSPGLGQFTVFFWGVRYLDVIGGFQVYASDKIAPFLLNHFPGGFSTYPFCCCVWNAWPGKLPARPESWSVHVHQTDHSIFNLHVWFDVHFCTYTYIIYIYDRFILQYTYVIICVIICTLNCIYAFRWKERMQ